MSAVIFLAGDSMAGVLGGIGRAYRAAFERFGHEFIEINLLDKSSAVQQLNTLGRMNVVLAFSFVAVGTDIMVDLPDGKSGDIWDVLHIPYISLYGDSPAYFFDRHVLRNPGYVGLYGFPEHLELRKHLPLVNGYIDTYPPVAFDAVPKSTLNFKKKAEGSVVILKNSNDPDKLIQLWTSGLAAKISTILLELASELRARINDPATTQIDNLVTAYFKSRNIDVLAFTKLRLFLIGMLDDYLRRYKSKLLIESLLDLPVLLNGYNWDYIDFSGKRLQYVPGGNYAASTTLLREALATIDMSPNTGLGPHDRPLRAFGAHTLCLTNEQEFFSRELPHSSDYFYRFDPGSIQSLVSGVLDNRQRSVDIGVTVAEAFMKKYTAEAFARQLLEIAPLARFNQLPGVPEGTPNYLAWPPTKL